MERPSLFDFAGGHDAFVRLATAHHQRCLDDPVLNHPFSHPGHPQHVERLAAYWAEVMGGPPAYSESCGTQASVLWLHAGTGAEEDLGDRFLRCFVAAADDAGLPADADFRAALRAYMQWAVSDMMSYAPHGSVVPERLPVPRWSWEGLESAAS
jgi:hemoglobin